MTTRAIKVTTGIAFLVIALCIQFWRPKTIARFEADATTEVRLVCLRDGLMVSTAQVRLIDLPAGAEYERWTVEASLDTWAECRALFREAVGATANAEALRIRFTSGAILSLPRFPWRERYGISASLRSSESSPCSEDWPEVSCQNRAP